MIRALLFGVIVAALGVPAGAIAPGRDSSHTTSQPTSRQPSRAPEAGLGGAPIPGLCMLSQSVVLSTAKVALAADARLKQLQQQVQTELKTEQTAIESDAQALQAERAGLSPDDFQKRQAPLQARVQAWQQKQEQRGRELAATREKALARIRAEAESVIAQAFRGHDCSVMIERSAVLLGDMTNDLTAEVVRGLDAKITTITFNRETLPAQ